MGSTETEMPERRVALDPITEIFKTTRTFAVVGLSSKSFRPSRGVAEYLQSSGYRIVPVNPHETEVLGEKAFARLEDLPFPVETVVIFRRPEHLPGIVQSAIAIGARAVWMQEGVVHHEAAETARKAGLLVVMDLCAMKEHVKRFRIGKP